MLHGNAMDVLRDSYREKNERSFLMRGEFFKVDSVIDICTDVMNLRSVSYECKCKLEEIKDDYKIEVSFLGHNTSSLRLELRNGLRHSLTEAFI